MDFEGREKAGLGGLAPYLEAMESAQSVEEYLDVLAMIRKDLGKASLMTLVPSADPKDSSKYALFFDEPNLLMEKEDFDDELAVEDMKVYLASLLEAYGMEKQDAKEWGEKVFDLCKDFADATLSKVERSNVEQTTNYYTDEELQAALTNVDVKKFFASSAQDQYATKVIQDPAMIEKINAYLSGEHLELLKKYSLVSLLHDFAPYLNNEFVQASARFYLMDDEDPDMIAWDSVQSLAEFEIGDMYAKRFFSPEKKVAAEKMAQDILAGYKSHIDGLDWLSEESKSEAKKKIDSMSVNIGYPEEYPSFVIDTVKSLQEGGTFIENALAISKAEAADEVEKSILPVDRQTWDLPPREVNAFYEATANQIVFPAAMLQEPFFNEKASYASNLGSIGTVIAHEIAHAFDDVGSLFDDQGNYRDWWTAEDRESFAERSKKFIEYFGSIEAVPGAKVDGELTLGENIADTSGISVIS